MTYAFRDIDPTHWKYLDSEARRIGMVSVSQLCNCGQCGRIHPSDCAVHNEPALPNGACDCVGAALKGTDDET